MCEITSDNFDLKFQEINYNLQKANYIGKLFKGILNFTILFLNIIFGPKPSTLSSLVCTLKTVNQV